MDNAGPSRTVPFLKDSSSFAVFAFGMIVGISGVAVVADMPTFSGYYMPEFWRVAGFALIGFIALIGSILALRRRRQAGMLLLCVAPIVGGCFAWWLGVEQRYTPAVTLIRPILVFSLASLPLAIPGGFWLTTSRSGWSPVLSLRFLPNKHSPRHRGYLFIRIMCARRDPAVLLPS